MMTQKNAPYLFIAILFALGAVMPFVLKQYHLNMLTEIIVFALFAVSYNLLLGYAGLLSFGHAMFFGTGAFTVAVALIHIPGLSMWSAIALALAMTTAVGFVAGGFCSGTRAPTSRCSPWPSTRFSTPSRRSGTPSRAAMTASASRGPISPWGSPRSTWPGSTSFYYFTLVIVGAAIVFCWYFTQTAMGQTVLLMRENEERMKFLGYNTNISRLILFTFTGAVAGLAGAFYTLHFQFCSQSAISVDMTTTVLLMTFVGGTGTFWGPMLGVLVYVILQNYLSDITDRWPLFMGLIFVFMVLFIPGGLTQIIQSIKTLFAGKRGTGKPIAAKEVSS